MRKVWRARRRNFGDLSCSAQAGMINRGNSIVVNKQFSSETMTDYPEKPPKTHSKPGDYAVFEWPFPVLMHVAFGLFSAHWMRSAGQR